MHLNSQIYALIYEAVMILIDGCDVLSYLNDGIFIIEASQALIMR